MYTILVPFLTKIVALRIFTDIFLTAILLAGIYATGRKKRGLIIAIVFSVPLFIATWSDNYLKSTILTSIAAASGSMFFAYMIVIFLSFLFILLLIFFSILLINHPNLKGKLKKMESPIIGRQHPYHSGIAVSYSRKSPKRANAEPIFWQTF